jgi:hypothetical protein
MLYMFQYDIVAVRFQVVTVLLRVVEMDMALQVPVAEMAEDLAGAVEGMVLASEAVVVGTVVVSEEAVVITTNDTGRRNLVLVEEEEVDLPFVEVLRVAALAAGNVNTLW